MTTSTRFRGVGLLLFLAGQLLRPAGRASAQSVDDVDATIRDGISRGIYPAAVVVIGRSDSILYARGYGHFTWNPASPVPTPDSTLWDIASISKVLGTASAVMRLVDAGRVDLDAPVSRYLPRFAGGARNMITVRMLLDHTSGLRSYAPLFKRARTRAGAIDQLYLETPVREPGAEPVYSDLNALFLGLLVEQVAKVPLDRFVTQEVFAPLDLQQTTYHPAAGIRRRVVPSAVWRGQPVAGQVNDPNAAVFGGVAGNAGIFTTGMDLAHYAQAWLREGSGPNGQWVSPATLKRFLTRGDKAGPRLLGWDTPELNLPEPSVFGTLISDAAYGHTGFTGTELWIDPSRDLFMVFLTNRTFDPRVGDSMHRLRTVRAQLSDAAVRLVPHACQQELVAR
ncbi:MAG TPA: serine hydrolase domain-containing protein, partial [Gemmatimonadales bacterium]|nr:serine hydrolase domain-containing protein [Gemmatimonadales bacterium]